MDTSQKERTGFFKSLAYLIYLIFQPGKGQRFFSWTLLLLLVVVPIAVVIAVAGWSDIYNRFLETQSPTIRVRDLPRGIGQLPVSITLELYDAKSGLDEVVVRTFQRGQPKELLRRRLDGKHKEEIKITFQGQASGLMEGDMELQVRAFDRSFWNNSAEAVYHFKVDYRSPHIEVLSTQHNARIGGSQLIFYRAIDENLAVSGVRVGPRAFLGFRASGIDRELRDPNLYVAIYAIDPLTGSANTPIRLFAEDLAGNPVTTRFYNKVLPRRPTRRRVDLTEGFLRARVAPVWEHNRERLHSVLAPDAAPAATMDMATAFTLMNEHLRPLNELDLEKELTTPRFERQWEGPFKRQGGTLRGTFGQWTEFFWQGQKISEYLEKGYEIAMSKGAPVLAANSGVVTYTGNVGVYGRTVVLDHGLGLFSLYGQLDDITVRRGDTVQAEEVIASAGESGLARQPGIIFQLRVNGMAVEPQEWLDSGWYYNHIVGKVNEVRRSLGLPLLRSF